jgi:D-alanyl-D-alanine carboxypeptidase
MLVTIYCGGIYLTVKKGFEIGDYREHLNHYLSASTKKLKNAEDIQILVATTNNWLYYIYPEDSSELPYHMASIGKIYTATLIFILIEQGKLKIDDLIADYLPQKNIEGLFDFQGEDYSKQVTIKDLLAHTSGAADYFEDPVKKGQSFINNVINNPDTIWTPEMLLDFSRTDQRAVGLPGSKFHYSDTGYILLGKLIETITGKPFHVNLHDEFFTPLEMKNSYLFFYSEPANQPQKPIRPIWVNKKEISKYKSLSCDWSGGGIISTTADQLKFQRALWKGDLISESSLARMQTFSNKFRPGIHYGLGMMELHFEEFFFLLKGLPRLKGHIGILANHSFFDPENDLHVIMNFGSTANMNKSFRVLIEIINSFLKINKF